MALNENFHIGDAERWIIEASETNDEKKKLQLTVSAVAALVVEMRKEMDWVRVEIRKIRGA